MKYIKKNYPNLYDWCFAIDNDEFITLERETDTLDDIFKYYEEYDAFMEKGLGEYTKDDLEATFDYDKYDTCGRVDEDFMKRVFAIPVSFRLFEKIR